MRTMSRWLIAAAVFIAPAAARTAEDDAAAIVDKAIKAHGGGDKLAKNKAEQWKVKGTFFGFDMKLPYTAEYFYQQPDKLRFDMTADFGKMGMIYNGKTAWQKNGDVVEEMGKDKLAEMQHMTYTMHLSQVLPLKNNKDLTLTVVPETKVNDRPAAGIKVASKGRRDVTLYFDKETGLLAKTLTRAQDELAGKEVTQEVLFSDWKEKDGVKSFGKMTINRDGKPFVEEEFTEHKSLKELDPKTFEKP